jgi:hypothetical protein
MALGAVFNPHQGRNRLLFLGKAHPKLRDDQEKNYTRKLWQAS